jgi:ubiquinone/menaquinone biosynthesis C-methylase UbiE
MDALFPAGSRILDVTAGTGLDAIHLVERDISVMACDISYAMLGQLREKNSLVSSFVADFNHLGLEGHFDGMISTFAGLSTSADLHPFAHGAAQLLRPGGNIVHPSTK